MASISETTNECSRGQRRLWILPVALCLCTAAAAQKAAPPVLVAPVGREAVTEEVPVTGTVSSPRVAQLSTEVAGLVNQVSAEAGDPVETGAILLTLDPTLAELALEAAEAATEQAREELSDARRRLSDARSLLKSRGIAETEIRARESEVRADAATLRLRMAQQRREEERLKRHEISAPFAGVISRKLTEAGEWVTPGDEVMELVGDSGLRIDFRVPQGLFPRIGTESVIEVRLDALPDRPIPARIGEIVPVSDPRARTFLMRVYPEEPDLPLTPGMSAAGLLKLQTGEREIVVSRDALLRHPDGRVTAWVVEGDGSSATVRETQVETGLAFDGRVAIRAGLEVGDRVVVEGNEVLQHGQQVSVRGER